jgi:23S rRNA pseudouridine1911/1915/1917 synthase
MTFDILYEDDYILVCYKPAGVPTQTSKLGEQDMVSLLKNYLYKKQTEKKEPYVGVIHRLDQPVEGLLVFAKTPFAAKELSVQVQRGTYFGKYYKAVLLGVPEQKQGTLENYLVKDGRTNTSRVCDKTEKDAKKAVLNYEVVGQGVDEEQKISIVNIKLDTGRHHQIRVQMAHMGHPILGDSKYNSMSQERNAGGQVALCAYRLEFAHPKTKKNMVFEIEPKGAGFCLDKNRKFQ